MRARRLCSARCCRRRGPTFPGISLAAHYRPASSAQVGEARRAVLADRVGLSAADLINELAELVPTPRPEEAIALLALTADPVGQRHLV